MNQNPAHMLSLIVGVGSIALMAWVLWGVGVTATGAVVGSVTLYVTGLLVAHYAVPMLAPYSPVINNE